MIKISLALSSPKQGQEKQTQKQAGIDKEKRSEILMPMAEDWQNNPAI